MLNNFILLLIYCCGCLLICIVTEAENTVTETEDYIPLDRYTCHFLYVV